MFAVYADTVRHTPGRPEQGTEAAYQGLWLLPKADMADIRNTMNKVRASFIVLQLAAAQTRMQRVSSREVTVHLAVS